MRERETKADAVDYFIWNIIILDLNIKWFFSSILCEMHALNDQCVSRKIVLYYTDCHIVCDCVCV